MFWSYLTGEKKSKRMQNWEIIQTLPLFSHWLFTLLKLNCYLYRLVMQIKEFLCRYLPLSKPFLCSHRMLFACTSFDMFIEQHRKSENKQSIGTRSLQFHRNANDLQPCFVINNRRIWAILCFGIRLSSVFARKKERR